MRLEAGRGCVVVTPSTPLQSDRTLPELDQAVAALANRRLALLEEEVLQPIWSTGEEIRLHEDGRFRRTPWGRWVLSEWHLANNALETAILRGWDGSDSEGRLRQLDLKNGGHHVFDPDDTRFHTVDISRRLVLSDLPLELRESGDTRSNSVEVFSILAAAGRFGTGESADSKGFVCLAETPKSQSFIVQAKGRSMEPEIPSGSYLLVHRTNATDGVVVAYHPDFQADLGSCVVKRWINGRLDSDHPDYRGQALLSDEISWQNVRVLGQVVRVLQPTDFPGLGLADPMPLAASKLTQEQQRVRAFDELEALRQRLLEEPFSGQAKDKPTSRIESSLELALDPPALRLRTPPLEIQEPFVSISGQRTPSSNLRYEKVWRISPQTIPYALQLAGDSSIELAPGLEGEAATLFTAPLQGRSRRLKTNILHGESENRCLVPPARQRCAPAVPLWASHLGEIENWLLYELSPPSHLSPEDLVWLAWMGLNFEPVILRVFLETVPSGFRALPSGESVPVVEPEHPVTLQLRGSELATPRLLVATTQAGQECLSLAKATDHPTLRVALEDCPAELILVRAQAGLALSPPLYFWVGEVEASPQIQSELQVDLANQHLQPGAQLDVVESWNQLRISAPPLWPVHLDSGGSIHDVVRLHSDANGEVSLSGVLAPLERRWKDQWFGSFQVMCPALCKITLNHAAPPSDKDLARRLRRLIDSIEDFEILELWEAETLWSHWLLPALKILGYTCQRDGADPTLWVLGSSILLGDPLEMSQELGALFTLTGVSAAEEMEAESDRLRLLMKQHRVSRGFASNGRFWLCVERSRRRPGCVIDILDVLSGDGLLDFCALFGAES